MQAARGRLAVGLACVLAAGSALAQLPPAPDPSGDDTMVLSIDSIVFQGLGPQTLLEADLRRVEVNLARVAGGWVAARPGLPSHRWRLGELDGIGMRLYGSALRSIVEAVSWAHYTQGRSRVRVDLRGGAVERRLGTDSLRDLIIELREPDDVRPPQWRWPAAVERVGADSVLLTVRSIAFTGLEGLGVSENELLGVVVDLAWDALQIPPGYVAARPGMPRLSVPLWELGRFGRSRNGTGAQVYGTAVQAILEGVAKRLFERGVRGVSVDIESGSVRHLSQPGSDGLLTIAVRRGPT